MSLCLTLCVGCSGPGKVVTVPQVIHIVPPAALMEPTPEPQCGHETNGDLADCYDATRAALRSANADKAAIAQAVKGAK